MTHVRIALGVAERGPDVRAIQLTVLNDVLSAVDFPDVMDSEMGMSPLEPASRKGPRQEPNLHGSDGRIWFRVAGDGSLDSLAILHGTMFPEIENRIVAAIQNAGSTKRLGIPPPGESGLIYLLSVYADSGHSNVPLFDSMYVRGPRADEPLSAPGNPKPRYPQELQDRGMQGTVLTQFVIDANGRMRPNSLRILKSSHVHFSRNVALTIPVMRFWPATVRGCPVPILVQMPFEFALW